MNFTIGLFLGFVIGVICTAILWMAVANYNYKNKYKSYGKRA